jgi:hypothetical protein
MMDVPPAMSNPSTMPGPNPKVSREMKSQCYHTIEPKTNMMSRESSSITRFNEAINSVAGLDEGRYTPKTYKEFLKQKDQNGLWESTKNKLNAIKPKSVWKVVPMYPT